MYVYNIFIIYIHTYIQLYGYNFTPCILVIINSNYLDLVSAGGHLIWQTQIGSLMSIATIQSAASDLVM